MDPDLTFRMQTGKTLTGVRFMPEEHARSPAWEIVRMDEDGVNPACAAYPAIQHSADKLFQGRHRGSRDRNVKARRKSVSFLIHGCQILRPASTEVSWQCCDEKPSGFPIKNRSEWEVAFPDARVSRLSNDGIGQESPSVFSRIARRSIADVASVPSNEWTVGLVRQPIWK